MELQVGIEDTVDDRPVVDRLAAGVLGVGVGRAPFHGGGAIPGDEQVVGANGNAHRRGRRQFTKQLLAIDRVGVIRLVIAEPCEDRWERTLFRRRVHPDAGLRRQGGGK